MTTPRTAAGRALVAILTNEAKLHHGVDRLSDNDMADILEIEAEARAAALDEARAAVAGVVEHGYYDRMIDRALTALDVLLEAK